MNPADSQVAAPFVKFLRSDATDQLMRFPNCFVLLAQIAQRARRDVPAFNPHNMQVGEAQVGDFETIGLTRQEFRTALANLQRWGLVTTRATNKGTIARLCNSDIYDINSEQSNQQLTSQQPAANQPATTNKNVKKKEDKGGADAPLPKSPKTGKDYASLDAADYLLPTWATDKFAADFTEWLTYRQGHRGGRLLKPSVDKILEELTNYGEEFCHQLFQHAIKNGNQGLTFSDTASKYAAFQTARPKQVAANNPHAKMGIAGRPTSTMTMSALDDLFAPGRSTVQEATQPYGISTLKVG